MQRQQAPFRADIVGSFLRPDSIKQARQQLAEGLIDAGQLRDIENNAIRHLVQQQCDCGLHVVTDGEFRRAWWHFDFFDGLQGVESIKQARQQLAEGIIDAGQLRDIENNAIRHLVQQQCDCGLHVVTDGEFRRAWWHFDFFDGLQGVERYDAEQGIQFNGVQTKAHGVRVTGKLAFGDHPMLEDFRYLKSISGDAQPKMTIPSPSVLHFRGGRKDIDATVYPDLSDYFDDLATTWRDAIRAFYDAGCRYLQLDDTVWAYLCSDAQRQQVRERGDDPDALARIYARVLNQALEGKPADLTVGLHVCRGNFRSTWISE
ncbi:methionine synthase vitamin-B12 independent [Klebsiella variicola CAG:634]|nr:methionine synthase vitamin-B12 independent [Klebsiella variicola CAG:634]